MNDDRLTPHTQPIYAGFWKRFNAYGIDATIVLIIAWLLDYLLPGSAHAQTADELKQLTDAVTALQTGQVSPELMETAKQSLVSSMFGGSILPGPDQYLLVAVSAIYNIFFAVGAWQATPGKHWMKIKITNAEGQPMSLMQSIMRHAASGISMLPMGLGYITIPYNRQKLAPHDMLCHTRVVLREPNA